MTLKQTTGAWTAIEEEASWCDTSTFVPTGMHIINSWEINPPAPNKEKILGQERFPTHTTVGIKQMVENTFTTDNLWNLRPIYFCLGSGDYTDGTGSIVKSNTPKNFKVFFRDDYGNERTLRGCRINSLTINVDPNRDLINYEYTFTSADIDAGDSGQVSKPTTISDKVKASDGTYTLKKNGTTISDHFMGGSLKIGNNLKTDVPDVENKRMYQPPVSNLSIEHEGDYWIDSANNFMLSYESGATGEYVLDWDIKDSNNTGIQVVVSGLQIMDYNDKAPAITESIVSQSITLSESEDTSIEVSSIALPDFT